MGCPPKKEYHLFLLVPFIRTASAINIETCGECPASQGHLGSLDRRYRSCRILAAETNELQNWRADHVLITIVHGRKGLPRTIVQPCINHLIPYSTDSPTGKPGQAHRVVN